MTDLYLVGDITPLTFLVYDATGGLVDPDSVTLTITLPGGTTATPTPSHDATGTYSYDYVNAAAGPYSASFVATGDNGGASQDNWLVVATAQNIVALTDAKSYLGDVTATDVQIALAIATEQAAQARRCRVDDYGPDLRGALLRRVARNLAAAQVPIAQFSSFDGVSTGARVTATDPEIERLERPYLRWAVR